MSSLCEEKSRDEFLPSPALCGLNSGENSPRPHSDAGRRVHINSGRCSTKMLDIPSFFNYSEAHLLHSISRHLTPDTYLESPITNRAGICVEGRFQVHFGTFGLTTWSFRVTESSFGIHNDIMFKIDDKYAFDHSVTVRSNRLNGKI